MLKALFTYYYWSELYMHLVLAPSNPAYFLALLKVGNVSFPLGMPFDDPPSHPQTL